MDSARALRSLLPALAALALLGACVGADDSGGPSPSDRGDGADAGRDTIGGRDLGPDIGDTDAPGDTTDDGAGGGGDVRDDLVEDCTDVCFAWSPPSVPATEAPDRIVYDQCNQFGLEPGVCPMGFACSAHGELDFGALVVELPVCESPSGEPYVVDLDVPAPSPLGETVPVTLRFELEGGPWPASAGGTAGTLTLVSVDNGRRLVADVPWDGRDALDLDLEPGVYSLVATLLGEGVDNQTFPAVYRLGRLVVVTAGEVVLPFTATRFSYRVAVDGVDLGPLDSGDSVALSLRSETGQAVSAFFDEGLTPAATVVLEPGEWRATVSTIAADGDSPLLDGGVRFEELELAAPSTSFRFDLRTVAIGGAVRIDGADLPAASSSGQVVFDPSDGLASRFAVGSDRPAHYDGRVYAGLYDVVYDATGTFMPGVPSMPGLAYDGVTAATGLDVDLPTVQISGELTVNGAPPADATSSRGNLWLEGAGGTRLIPLHSSGDADWNIPVFTGRYDVRISGDGVSVPQPLWPLADDWTASTTFRRFNLDAHWLSVTVTHDGSTPPPATGNFRPRGALVLESPGATELPGLPAVTHTVPWPEDGALSAEVFLPVGRWHLFHELRNPDYTGLPQGRAALGELQLTADRSASYDIHSVEVEGQVLWGGAAFPPAAAGLDRGVVHVDNHHGGASQVLTGTGPASYRVWVYPGLQHVTWTCLADDGCDPSFGDGGYYLYYGVNLQ